MWFYNILSVVIAIIVAIAALYFIIPFVRIETR